MFAAPVSVLAGTLRESEPESEPTLLQTCDKGGGGAPSFDADDTSLRHGILAVPLSCARVCCVSAPAAVGADVVRTAEVLSFPAVFCSAESVACVLEAGLSIMIFSVSSLYY